MANLTRFDLTTVDGRRVARDILEMAFPAIPLARYVVEKLSSAISTEREAEIARSLIKQGKTDGVSEMKIKLSKKAGLSLGGGVEGVPLKIGAEYDGTVEIEVKYVRP